MKLAIPKHRYCYPRIDTARGPIKCTLDDIDEMWDVCEMIQDKYRGGYYHYRRCRLLTQKQFVELRRGVVWWKSGDGWALRRYWKFMLAAKVWDVLGARARP